MAKKKSPTEAFFEKMQRIREAGLGERSHLKQSNTDHSLLPLSVRLPLVEKILRKYHLKKPTDMYAFILYDIENNKIRNHVAKFLLKKGCIRVQKSVFLANLKRKEYEEIHTTINKVNSMYDNHDSFFFIPVGEDILNNMKIVGKNVDFELIVNPGNTFFV